MKHYGLLGTRLTHSLSPLIHQEIFLINNINAHYTLWEIPEDRLSHILPAFHTLGFCGINITIPYKKSLLPFFDEISSQAKSIGAANTVFFHNGKSIAHNTDVTGCRLMLNNAGISLKDKSVCILGTGGAALAAVASCKELEAGEIYFLSRNEKGTLLDCPILPYAHIKKGDLVINATPVGMYPHCEESPLQPQDLSLFEVAADLIYNPKQTFFLKEAQKLGLKTIGGLDMLIGQAMEAQKLWNNWYFTDHDFNRIKEKVEQIL